MPAVHRVDKGVDPNIKPERQILKSPIPTMQPNKPRLGQGRASPSRKTKVPIQGQMQMQPKNGSQIKEQTLSKQKEGIQTPLTKLLTDT